MDLHAHNHAPASSPAPADARDAFRRIRLALALTLGFVVIEAFAGWAANSLALLSDALHNLTDSLALVFSAYALRMSLRPPDARRTYGHHRTGILAALVNSASLMAIAGWILYDAYRRLLAPPDVDAAILAVAGFAAFVVNGVTALLVMRGSERDLNLRSAFLHLSGDVLSTAGAAAAGVAILLTGARWLDPLAAAVIGLLILWSAWGIVRESLDILLEKAPADVDVDRLAADLRGVEGVRGVHDLHVWSITRSLRALSAHVLTGEIGMPEGAAIRARIDALLCERYRISHSTLQLEHEACAPGSLFCDLHRGGDASAGAD